MSTREAGTDISIYKDISRNNFTNYTLPNQLWYIPKVLTLAAFKFQLDMHICVCVYIQTHTHMYIYIYISGGRNHYFKKCINRAYPFISIQLYS